MQSKHKDRQSLKVLLAIAFLTLLAGLVSFLGPQHHSDEDVYVSTNPRQIPALLKLPRDEPIDMLNLIQFKDVADYETGSGFEDKGWSGAEAYHEYARRSQIVIDRLEADIVYAGKPLITVIGPTDEKWDAMFVLRYENATVFRALLEDPDYKAHAFHRKAGVANSRLVRLDPAPKLMPGLK